MASDKRADTDHLLQIHTASQRRRPQTLHTPFAETHVFIKIKACV
jgi:hypothetical protein